VGFDDIAVVDRRPFGLEDLNRYPPVAPDSLAFLRRVMPPSRHSELVVSVVITACKPLDDVRKPLGRQE
jgi:hypothetical protein